MMMERQGYHPRKQRGEEAGAAFGAKKGKKHGTRKGGGTNKPCGVMTAKKGKKRSIARRATRTESRERKDLAKERCCDRKGEKGWQSKEKRF